MQTQSNIAFPPSAKDELVNQISSLESKYENAVATMETYELAIQALDDQLKYYPTGDEQTWPHLNAIKNLETFAKSQREYADALTVCISKGQDHLEAYDPETVSEEAARAIFSHV